MKIRHWSLCNGSGLAGVAQSLADGETAAGHDSKVVNSTLQDDSWIEAESADVAVVHSHLPNPVQDRIRKAGKKQAVVWVGHGTPDHVFQSAAEYAQSGGYGHPEPLMLLHHWLKDADAHVTFWERHQWIYQRLAGKRTPIHLVPLGVHKAFWSAGASRGKFDGAPSVFTAENPHYIKWPYDLLTLWPDVAEALDGGMAKLHAIYIPRDMHAVFYPWAYANGAAYYGFLSPSTFDAEGLRNAFQSTDFTVGLVRYGDHNQLSMQANAAGAKTISYRGNPYADYWVTEGDQRVIAQELTAILAGRVAPREKTPVPDLTEMVAAMLAVYEDVAT
ncbi:MAG: hypothetical protein KGI71_05380 [Patescibacteria group bacterium]|nr:hypothetical protein [Patescibacteria group bacterium]